MSPRPPSRTAGERSGWKTRTVTCSRWGSRPLLRHVDPDRVVAHRATGIARRIVRLLRGARAVGGTHGQVVRAFLWWCPVEVPQHPGELGQRRGPQRFGPRGAPIGGDLHLANATRPGVRDTADGDAADLHDVAVARYVEARGRLHDGVVVPALLLPVPAALVIDQLDLGKPLRSLHPVATRDEDARGIAVRSWQLLTVELVGDQDRRVRVDRRKGEALGVAVGRLERGPCRR